MDTKVSDEVSAEDLPKVISKATTPILKHPSLPEGVYNKLKNNFRGI